MKSKIGSKIVALTVLIGWISMPRLFADDFNYYKMSLGTNVSSKILPLEGLEGNLYSSQQNRIMRNGFLISGTESFGYFRITLSSEFIGYGKRDTGLTILASILAALSFGTSVLVTPFGEYRYNLSAIVEILDTTKKVIKTYPKSTMFDAVYKIYGDEDYTFKAEPSYQNLLRDCLTEASRESDEINAALICAKMSGKIPANARIAVISANKNPDVLQGSRQIETQLFDTGKFKVVERANIDKLIAEILLSRTVYVNDAIEIGRILSTQYIIYVEVTGEGATRKIHYKVLSVRTGEIIASFASTLR